MKIAYTNSSDCPVARQGGFALVATISVMVLLVLVALSMLSLSAIELRTSNRNAAMTEAQANARMAMMIALNELQEAAGPDQRVMANAGILDTNERTVAVDGVGNPNWMGVWRAFDNWLTAEDSEGNSISDTYTKGRESHFNRWLVSHANPESLKMLDGALNSLADSDSVILVSERGLSPSNRQASYRAGLLDIAGNSNLSSGPKGRYAWGVMDEGSKARIDHYDREIVAGNLSESDLQMRLNNSPRAGMEWLEDLESSPARDADWKRLGKIISLATGSQLEPGDQDYRDALRAYFHDLTTASVSLPVDVRRGGLKKDLNLLMERDVLPREYGRFNRTGPRHNRIVPIRAYTPDVPGGSSSYELNLSSWYKMHQFYRMAHADSIEESPGDVPGLSAQKGVYWNSGSRPGLDFYWHSNNMDEFGTARGPIISRVMLILSVNGRGSNTDGELNLYIKPVVGLWNPYNVPLKMNPQRLISRGNTVRFRVTDGSITRSYDIPFPRSVYQGWLSIRLSNSGAPGDQSPIILQPGENRLFSAGFPIHPLSNEFHARSGYDTSELGHRINIWKGATGIPDLSSEFANKSPVGLEMSFVLRPVDRADGFGQYYWFLADGYEEGPGSGEYGFRLRHNEFTASPLPRTQSILMVPHTAGQRIRVATEPEQAGAFQFLLKSGENLRNLAPITDKDYRCKNWVIASPTNRRALGGQAVDMIHGTSQYYFQVLRGGGNTLHPDFEEDTNRGVLLSYMGTKINDSSPGYDGQTHCIATEFPSAPLCSIASFMHFPTNPGKTGGPRSNGDPIYSHVWGVSVNSALSIGNSFGHPMIDANRVYRDVPEAVPSNGFEHFQEEIRHFHDHSFLNNDALWDRWFCSTITAQQEGPFANRRGLQTVLEQFMSGEKMLPNSRLAFDANGRDTTNILSELLSSGEPNDDAHKTIARYLSIKGGFNVNSTSKVAWKALFTGLKGRSLAWFDGESNQLRQEQFYDHVLVSRYSLAGSASEGSDAGSPDSWKGIRLLTDAQIDRLAEECVRQVKLRGPFLNMADFINRRLTTDTELARCGALQAAIDWDEFNGNSPSSSDPESINGRFKGGGDMAPDAGGWGVPFPDAAKGSLYTGIPGYVTQADLLKGIGNQITPRSDTFRIRAYGESLDQSTGRVLARAWCEAIVVRTHEYVDGANEPDEQVVDLEGNETNALVAMNERFGRKFRVASFRWLSKDEI